MGAYSVKRKQEVWVSRYKNRSHDHDVGAVSTGLEERCMGACLIWGMVMLGGCGA